jgi:hypothetical protein
MRYSFSKALGVGLLSILFLQSNGNPVTHDLVCVGENCNGLRSIDRGLVKGLLSPHKKILPRAGGGGRPDRPNDRGPDGAPVDKPNDLNNPSVPSNQNGEEGGFQGQPESGGGFTNICERRIRWHFWSRSGCGPGTTNPAPATREGPPSSKNNYLQSSTEGEPIVTNRPIDIGARKARFQADIQNLQGVQKGPWFFYSGFKLDEVDTWKGEVQIKLNTKIGYIRNLVDIRGPPYMEEFQRFSSDNNQWYFWAANSKAFSQAIEGKVYAVIPHDTSINQPYENQGSNWWSYELPELTRNDKVDSISVYYADPMDMGDALGEAKVIWQRGDAPIGFPGDERRHYTRPTEPWNG